MNSLLNIEIEKADPEEYESTRTKGGSPLITEIAAAIRQLQVGQKFSLPKSYKSKVNTARKLPEFEPLKLTVKTSPDKLFIKVIRLA